MKQCILILCFALISNFQILGAQAEVNHDDIIKDENGKVIDFKTFNTLMASGDWTYISSRDEDSNSYYQLKRMSVFEKDFRAKILKQKNKQLELIGKKAPDFDFIDIKGNSITTANTKGKVLVLNFWFIACKPCIDEIPELNAVYNTYKDRNDIIFASITFDKKEQVESFLEDTSINYQVVADSKSTISDFDVFAYPTNIVIDKNGNYTDITSGGFSGIGERVQDAIEKVLN